MKLTLAQHCTLVDLNDLSPASAYRMGVSLATLNALKKKGLASADGGLGSMFAPRNMLWRITDAGRSALRDGGGK